MIKVRTKEEVNYDSVNPLRIAKISVEMTDWREQQDGAYYASVNYYAEPLNSNSFFLKSRQIYISEDKFNQLYLAVDGGIPSNLTPYQKRELRKKLALLTYVTNDFIDDTQTKLIYGTTPIDWELINE